MTAWQEAAAERWRQNLRACLERCARSGEAYEAAHIAEAFDCSPQRVHDYAKRWGLQHVLRNGLPTLEEIRAIQVPGQAQDPTGRSFKAPRLWGVKP